MFENEYGTNMSDNERPSASAMAAFSNVLEDLSKSLDVLYITNNAGGRRIFQEKWPEIAKYLFGEALMAFDLTGVEGEDQRTRRSQLEEEADLRRIDLKKTIKDMAKKSVDSGSLQFDYVGSVIDKYGAALSKFLYNEDIIERVRPGVLDKAKREQESQGSKENTVPSESEGGVQPQVFSATPVTEAAATEQSGNMERDTNIPETQQTPEQETVQQKEQQYGSVGALDEVSPLQNEIVTESFGEQPIQSSPESQGEAGEARLSAEEIEILSNKEAMAPDVVPKVEDEVISMPEAPMQMPDEAAFAVLEEGGLPSLQEADPLHEVRPIETPVPENVMPEEEPMKVVVEPEIEPVESEGMQGQEGAFVQQVQTQPIDNVAESHDYEQEPQGLDVADFSEAGDVMAAKNITGAEEILSDEPLQQEGFVAQVQQKEPEESIFEKEVNAPVDEMSVEPESDQALSLEEDALKDDLEQALKVTQEEERRVASIQPEAGGAEQEESEPLEIQIKRRPQDKASDNQEIPEIMKYAAEKEETGLRIESKNEEPEQKQQDSQQEDSGQTGLLS